MVQIPAELAVVTQLIRGKEVKVHIHELGDVQSIPAKEGGQYISRFCDYKIENGPYEYIVVGMDHYSVNVHTSAGWTEKLEQELQQWITRRGHAIATEILCGRVKYDPSVPPFAIVDLEAHPYVKDLNAHRTRCRYDVLKVLDQHLNTYKRNQWLELIHFRQLDKLSRYYFDQELASALSYWYKKGIIAQGTLDLKYLISEEVDEEIAQLLAEYNWEECTDNVQQSISLVTSEKEYDVFISHASEDKDSFVRPLAEALKVAGVKTWYDEHTLKWGDKLRAKIDHGLTNSRFGIVVLSKPFFMKEWPQNELEGLFALESSGQSIIRPIWHGLDASEVRDRSPMLAGRVALNSNIGVDAIVREVIEMIGQ